MTGLPHLNVFDWILSLIKDKVTLTWKRMMHESCLLLVLIKIRLSIANNDLAHRLRINYGMVSKIYCSWLAILSKALQRLIFWPSKGALCQHLPPAFEIYKSCPCIIDCTEIFIERPLNLEAPSITWSNYKHTNTIKYLIGISPADAVTRVRLSWLLNLWRLDFSKQGTPYCRRDGNKGAVLAIPSFTREKSQMPVKDVDESRKIDHVCIHVERVIDQVKTFKNLNSTIPISQLNFLDFFKDFLWLLFQP